MITCSLPTPLVTVADGYTEAFPWYEYETLCSIGYVVSQQI